jgi:hypothetical protein
VSSMLRAFRPLNSIERPMFLLHFRRATRLIFPIVGVIYLEDSVHSCVAFASVFLQSMSLS